MAVVINGLTGIEAPSVTLDTDTLVIDADNNRVGIGTASPAYSLDIDGNARLNPTSNPVLRFSENGTLRSLITGSSSIGLGIETQGALPFRVVTNGSESMRIDSSGNVGIGTTSPQGAIGIRDSGSTSELFFTADAVSFPNDLQIYIGDAGPNLKIDDGFTFRISHQSAERLRIDSSGNLLVGQSSTTNPASGNVVGSSLQAAGQLNITNDGGITANFNRKSSDGDIVRFRKDGTTVGSIGVVSGDNLYFTGATGSTKGFYLNNNTFGPGATGTPFATADNAVNLGATSARWKDLYLSGGVYLGGTGSANYLDDYEEGTSTVSVNGITASTNTVNMNYVKVGNLVHIIGEMVISGKSGNSGNANFALPFVPSQTHSFSSTVGATIHYNTISSSIDYFGLYGGNASVYGNDATGSFTNNYINGGSYTDGRIGFVLTYTSF